VIGAVALTGDRRRAPAPPALGRPLRGQAAEVASSGQTGCGAAWQRACFGSRRSGVQIPASRREGLGPQIPWRGVSSGPPGRGSRPICATNPAGEKTGGRCSKGRATDHASNSAPAAISRRPTAAVLYTQTPPAPEGRDGSLVRTQVASPCAPPEGRVPSPPHTGPVGVAPRGGLREPALRRPLRLRRWATLSA
jgi:hypothetical protein